MKIIFDEQAWDDYLYWQKHDRKLLTRLNSLIKECTRTPFDGTGKPEPLKGQLAGWWSRRLNREHRLVYRVEGEQLLIALCRYHY
ncbi:Txe/YoeB family addiction module toxin [Palleronia caenipelagi]|uniref:Putative mRNA interferase YoeB n=1 Tax=Palleronia caenipelagi TaxID=2489174 RepID=A0A547PKU7_9RHOB|nr:Txe/YoeB family addiction module toxin [Palleronia caenipelagi]TRD14769.1 Txe/YoeB family addiction module toxin [Palleronia caenipelagi]